MAPIASGIHDNHKRGRVGEFLKAKIRKGADLSIVSAYFTIYAFEALKDQLLGINHLNFLFGEPGFIRSLYPAKTIRRKTDHLWDGRWWDKMPANAVIMRIRRLSPDKYKSPTNIFSALQIGA